MMKDTLLSPILASRVFRLPFGRLVPGLPAALLAAPFAVLLALPSGMAHAKEEFAKQTKQPCSACHTHGYPLTPLGKAYQANNYKLPPCKPATIKLYDRKGKFWRTYTGCFPAFGRKVTIGQ